MSDFDSSTEVESGISTNVIYGTGLNVSRGDEDRSRKALRMIRSKAGQENAAPEDICISRVRPIPI